MPLALAIVGIAASAAGTGMQIAGNEKAKRAIEERKGKYNAKQAALEKKNAELANNAIAGSGADVARKEMEAGRTGRNKIWESINQQAQPVAQALPAVSGGASEARGRAAGNAWSRLNTNAASTVGSMADWQTQQAIENADTAREIGMNNNFAQGNTRLLPTQLEVASQAGDRLSGWGQIVKSLGGIASMAGGAMGGAGGAAGATQSGQVSAAQSQSVMDEFNGKGMPGMAGEGPSGSDYMSKFDSIPTNIYR